MALTKRKLTVVPPQTSDTAHARQGGHDHEPYDPVHTDADASISVVLRQARQMAGYSLRDVASLLRLRLIYLEAIEDGRFDALPGPTYAVGFVRTYAELLGLDAEETVRRFKSEVSGIDKKKQLVFPAPAPEGRMPGGALILIAMLLAGLAYGGWYYISSNNYQVADLVPALPERFTALLDGTPLAQPAADAPATEDAAPEVAEVAEAPAGAETNGAVAEPPPATPAPGPGPVTTVPLAAVTPPQPQPATPTAAAAPAPAPAPAAAPAPATVAAPPAAEPEIDPEEVEVTALPDEIAPPPPPPPAAADTPEGPTSRVVLRAVADSWVQVRDARGNLVMTRVLQPGDEYAVPDTPGLRLVTGNAGGLDVIVDGEPIPRLGQPGDVVRNILLDPDRLRDGTALN